MHHGPGAAPGAVLAERTQTENASNFSARPQRDYPALTFGSIAVALPWSIAVASAALNP